ncbi:MAG: hypothetical protein IK118_07490 [Clostridia bacterium]|nr:hypothetical protein [Clostridia bacterium]
MLSENVEKVLAAESDVSELFEKTDNYLAKAQEDTHAEAKALIEQKTAEAKTYAAKLMRDAEEKTKEIYEEYRQQANAQIAVMNAEADERVPAAIRAVKETILG